MAIFGGVLNLAIDRQANVLSNNGRLRNLGIVRPLADIHLDPQQARRSGQVLIQFQFHACRPVAFRADIANHVGGKLTVRIGAQTALPDLQPVQLHVLQRFGFGFGDVIVNDEVAVMMFRSRGRLEIGLQSGAHRGSECVASKAAAMDLSGMRRRIDDRDLQRAN